MSDRPCWLCWHFPRSGCSPDIFLVSNQSRFSLMSHPLSYTCLIVTICPAVFAETRSWNKQSFPHLNRVVGIFSSWQPASWTIPSDMYASYLINPFLCIWMCMFSHCAENKRLLSLQPITHKTSWLKFQPGNCKFLNPFGANLTKFYDRYCGRGWADGWKRITKRYRCHQMAREGMERWHEK